MQTYPEPVPPAAAPGRKRPRLLSGPRWAQLCVIGGLVLVMVSALFVGGGKAFNWYASGKVPTEPLLSPNQLGKNISGPINILLIGMDKRTNSTDLIHTDSVIIVHINAEHNAATMVSLPRDSMVSAPPFPASKFAGLDHLKLTEVYSYGNQKRTAQGTVGDDSPAGRARGVQLLTTVLNGLVPGGIVFNAVAIINYVGFERLVHAMGGVTMCVDETVWSEHFTKDGKQVTSTHGNRSLAKTYTRGCRHLLPWEALDYVRQREHMELNDGDYGRQRHQQQFLSAVFKQLLSKQTLTDPTRFGALANAAGGLLTLDLGGNDLLDWIFTLKHIRSSDITMVKTNAGKFAPIVIDKKEYEKVVPDTVALLKAVHDDTVETFLAQHPTWIGRSDAP